MLIASTISIQATPFVIGDLTCGQFGNQLFVIAATTSTALDHQVEALFPALLTHTENGIPANYQKVFAHLNTSTPQEPIAYIYQENYSTSTYNAIEYHPNMVLRGYFQSEKYFSNHKKTIIDLFEPSPEILAHLKSNYQKIIDLPNSVAIHARSYLNEHPITAAKHITYDAVYFEKAMSQFPAETPFIVFSNDMSWCKKQFAASKRNIYFIEGDHYIHDFYLISLCKHQIITNSSFSWWAAYLNKNPAKIVIVPPRWFHPDFNYDVKDHIPASWKILTD